MTMWLCKSIFCWWCTSSILNHFKAPFLKLWTPLSWLIRDILRALKFWESKTTLQTENVMFHCYLLTLGENCQPKYKPHLANKIIEELLCKSRLKVFYVVNSMMGPGYHRIDLCIHKTVSLVFHPASSGWMLLRVRLTYKRPQCRFLKLVDDWRDLRRAMNEE